MNRTPRVLYDVYEDGKLRYRLISLSKAAEVAGTACSIITRSAENGHKIHKKYTVKVAWRSDCEKEYTESETRRKLGDKLYDEWQQLNRRYGKRWGGNDGRDKRIL